MKSNAIFRICMLTFTVAFLTAFAIEYNGNFLKSVKTDPTVTEAALVAESTYPVAGISHPIAGQEEPEAEIILHAPDFVEVGELVRLDARDSTVDKLTWQIIPYTDDFEVIEGGVRAFLSSKTPGEYLIIIAGAKGGEPYLIHQRIIVEGEEVAPGPESLESKVAGWVRKVDNYDGKQAKGIAIAMVFREIAGKEDIAVDQILEATALANSAVLAGDVDKWVPFLDALGHELDGYELSTREEYKSLWLSIANGIEKALKKG